MTQRILAGVVALLVVVPVLIWGGQSGVAGLVALVLGVCVLEYTGMAFPNHRISTTLFTALGVGGLYVSVMWGDSNAVLFTLCGVVIGSQLMGLLGPGDEVTQGADRMGRLMLGVFWMSLLVFAPLLRRVGLNWLCLALVVAWSSDTGAYFVGRAFGRHKLYHRVSPNKTWEGFFGGLAACVASVLAFNEVFSLNLTVADCLFIAVLAGSMSVLGDLVESLLKRSFGVKDSGRIMPGHGGLLDRVDSLLFVCPTLYGYLWISGGV